jgi:hypothetical protein
MCACLNLNKYVSVHIFVKYYIRYNEAANANFVIRSLENSMVQNAQKYFITIAKIGLKFTFFSEKKLNDLRVFLG